MHGSAQHLIVVLMRRILPGVAAIAAAMVVMGAGTPSGAAAARAVIASYYADLSAKDYVGACRVLSTATIKAAAQALLTSRPYRTAAAAALASPTAAHCAPLIAADVTLNRVDVEAARNIRITDVRVSGRTATAQVSRVPGARGTLLRETAYVVEQSGRWVLVGFRDA